MAATAILQNKK